MLPFQQQGVLASQAGGGGAGGGSDVTLTAVDWTNITGDVAGLSNDQTAAGIDTPVTIKMTQTGAGQIYYSKNSGSSWNAIASGGTLSWSVGETLMWIAVSGGSTVSGTLTIINVSDTNTTIDTLTYYVTFSG